MGTILSKKYLGTLTSNQMKTLKRIQIWNVVDWCDYIIFVLIFFIWCSQMFLIWNYDYIKLVRTNEDLPYIN